MQKKILIIAGPNGAGKSTFAREFLPNEADCPVFINADLIAAGLSPFQPDIAAIKAGRLMLEEIRDYVARGRNFAFETTLAGQGYLKQIRNWRSQDYQIKLFFLALQSSEEAISRVAARVAQGGHHVPDEVVRRRFYAGLDHFESVYKSEVNFWRFYNNSGDVPLLIEEGSN
ncbi:MAG: AAA family ATPase [Candidatus Obscuribacterales bacterium]|jgi:predicted ABC-type ATPase